MDILFRKCGHCNGEGKVAYNGKKRRCKQCSGSGIAPTELGEHIILFLSTFCRFNPNVKK